MYYIYIIYSQNSDKYYLGYTDDPELRLKRHNTCCYTSYTHKHRPWEMKKVFEIGESGNEAIRIERYIKRQKSRQFLEELIKTKDLSRIKARVIGEERNTGAVG
ncbi:MAG: GIY-YIG nuclease family protein [Bacteroidales bacterium]|nr:GIY-YIG nuclease family protein [Bacteroidales bacterium]